MTTRAWVGVLVGVMVGACSGGKAPEAPKAPDPPPASSAELDSSVKPPGGDPELVRCGAVCRVRDLTPEVIASLEAKHSRETLVIEFHSQTTQEQLKAVSKLTWVRKLHLKGMGITDLSPLSALQDLEALDLVGTGVKDLKPISSLPRLKHIYITSGTSLVAPWPGKPLPPVKEVVEKLAQADHPHLPGEGTDPEDFEHTVPPTTNHEPDLSSLAQLASLRELRLTGLKVPPAVWKSLTQVTSLDLTSMKLEDPTALAGITGLFELSLRKVHVPSYDFLKQLPALELLTVAQSRLTDLAFASGVKKLRRLHVPENPQLVSIAPLKGLQTVEVVDIDDTGVADLAPLATLPKLNFLDAQGAPVKSLAPLAKLILLRVLNLRRSKVTDLAPLATCEALTHVHLPEGIDKAQIEALKKARPGVHVLTY